MTDSDNVELLAVTSRQAARMLGCCERQVYNLRKAGLPFFMLGGSVRFRVADLRSFVDAAVERERRKINEASRESDS